MTVTIYHNPSCSKSRETLEIIRAQGIEPQIRDYIKNGIDLAELKEIYTKLKSDDPLSMIRSFEHRNEITLRFFEPQNETPPPTPSAILASLRETTAKVRASLSNDDIFKLLERSPKFLVCPIVITPKGARICRPPEIVNEIL